MTGRYFARNASATAPQSISRALPMCFPARASNAAQIAATSAHSACPTLWKSTCSDNVSARQFFLTRWFHSASADSRGLIAGDNGGDRGGGAPISQGAGRIAQSQGVPKEEARPQSATFCFCASRKIAARRPAQRKTRPGNNNYMLGVTPPSGG